MEGMRVGKRLEIWILLTLLILPPAASASSRPDRPRRQAHSVEGFNQVMRENAHFFGMLVNFAFTTAISDGFWGVTSKNLNLNLISREVRDGQGHQYVRARVAGTVRKNANVELDILDEKGNLVGKGFLGAESGELTFFNAQAKPIIQGYFDGSGNFVLNDLRLPSNQQLLVQGWTDLCYYCSYLTYGWFDAVEYQVGGGRIFPDFYSGSRDKMPVYWTFEEGGLNDSTPSFGEAEYELGSEVKGAINSVLFDTNRTAASFFANPYSQVPEPVGKAYLPRVTNETGIAITNPNDREISITCVARTFDGKVVSGDGIENPVTYTFAAGQQVPAYPDEIFRGFSDTDRRPIFRDGESGWVEIFSDDGAVQALFLESSPDGSALDGNAAPDAGAQKIVFPDLRLKAGESTEISLLNLSYDDAVVRLELLDREGQVLRQEPEFFMAGFGMRNFYVGPGSSFLSVSDFNAVGSLRVTCNTTNSLLATNCARVVGLATFKDRFGSIATSYAVSTDTGGTELVAAHFVTGRSGGGNWSTTVRLSKLSGGRASVYLDLYDRSGVLLQTLREVIGEGGTAIFALEPSGLPWGGEFTNGYLRVRSDSGVVGGDVSIAWTDGGGSLYSAYPLSNYLDKNLEFNQVAQGPAGSVEYWTGLAVLNDLNKQVRAKVMVYTSEGLLDRQVEVVLEPYAQKVGLLSQFLGESGYTRVNGYIRVEASDPVSAIVLYGDSLNRFLAAVPGAPR